MSKFNVKQRYVMNQVAQEYEAQLRDRLTPLQFKRVKLDKYTAAWKKIADLLSELDITPKQWMVAQFHELPRDVCLRLFHLAAPPPNVLSTDSAVDRFMTFVGRNNTLAVVNQDEMEGRAYASSLNFIQMLKQTTLIVDDYSPDWLDLILLHMNSGDVSLVWFQRQPLEWRTTFMARNGSALNEDILDALDKRLQHEMLRRLPCSPRRQ